MTRKGGAVHGHIDNAAWRSAKKAAVFKARGICVLCGKPLDPTKPRAHPLRTEIDHIIPVSQGGHPYDINNLRAVHRVCHQRRDRKPEPETWSNGLWFCRHVHCCPHSRQW